MGAHRKAIRRKPPLTQVHKDIKRKDAIKLLHNELKSGTPQQASSIPLAIYQEASSRGQSSDRGGDSSKILVEWLKSTKSIPKRTLEIGCLEVDNAIAKYIGNKGSLRRIDLKSRDPQIEEQDFMTLKIPEQKYELISLSLVLNFVPSPQGRYEMLRRTVDFLQRMEDMVFPALFVVLPLPCVANSRYLTREHFLDIMASLGYQVIQQKESKRIAYWLFQWNGEVQEQEWKKKVIQDGVRRNNFAICNV